MKFKPIITLSALTLALFACDSAYDLSDIDTSVQIEVNDLTVPINIDNISLDNIISIKEGENIKVINGEYAFVQEGSFTSDPFKINPIILSTPPIESFQTQISLGDMAGMTIPADMPATDFSLDISAEQDPFKYQSDNVSTFIVSIEKVGLDMSLELGVELPGLENIASKAKFTDVVLQLPKGLIMPQTQDGTYYPSTGLFEMNERTVNGNSLTLTLKATGVNFPLSGGVYNFGAHHITVEGALYVKQGRVTVNTADIRPGTRLPQSIGMNVTYNVPDCQVTSFTGKVQYTVENTGVEDVTLNNLPDLLTNPNTNLSIANPCIFLSITNPVQKYGLYARTGMSITAHRTDEPSRTFPINDPWFQIGPDNTTGVYNYCLSPSEPSYVPQGFENPEPVPYTKLSDVLSGHGLPSSLSIDFQSPNLPAQPVKDLLIGSELGSLSGSYYFYAPLQLAAGSSIIYTDDLTGWGSEDLEKINITHLSITLDITTDIPVAVKLSGYPIDKQGNRIGTARLTCTPTTIPASTKCQKITLELTQPISGRDLDGIHFEATALSAADAAALSPNMNIRLSSIRPKISGFYTDKL